jgi:hypothetical protein
MPASPITIPRPVLQWNEHDYSQYLIVVLLLFAVWNVFFPRYITFRWGWGFTAKFEPEPGSPWLWITRLLAAVAVWVLWWMLFHDGPFTI